MVANPTLIIVPGAWNLPIVYDPLRSILSERGYGTEVPGHPSIGAEPADKTLGDDIASLRQLLVRLADRGEDLIVVAHSYGGIVGSGAVEGLGKKQRAQEGKQGGILMIAYLSAFVVPQGRSLKDMLGGQLPPWVTVEGDKAFCAAGADVAYQDLPKNELEKWQAALTHTSVRVFAGHATHEPWHHMPSAFIFCDEDHAVPPPAQEQMAQLLGTQTTYRLPSSHSPFLSMPDKLADVLENLVAEAKKLQ